MKTVSLTRIETDEGHTYEIAPDMDAELIRIEWGDEILLTLSVEDADAVAGALAKAIDEIKARVTS